MFLVLMWIGYIDVGSFETNYVFGTDIVDITFVESITLFENRAIFVDLYMLYYTVQILVKRGVSIWSAI